MSELEERLFKLFGKEFPAGSVLTKEGDTGDEMFIIQSGKVKIVKNIGGQEKLLAVLGPGDFFGEMAILLQEPRSADAVVDEDAKILVIKSDTFKEMIKANPEIAYKIMKKLAKRIKDANAQIADLLSKDKNQKIVHAVIRFAREQGKESEEGIEIEIGVDDLAKYTGLAMEDVEDVAKRLMRANLIRVSAKGFVVPSIDKLEKFLEYLAMKEQFGEID